MGHQSHKKIMEVNGVLAQVCFTGTKWSINPSCGYFPSSRMHKWDTHTHTQFTSCPDPHIGSLTLAVRDTMVGKPKKSLELPLPRKLVNQNQYHILKGFTGISAINKNLKNADVMILTTSPFNTPIWPVPKTDGS